ncbi:hypothetical protein QIS99_30100 [Streptomyces sp. B-S-A8]|uniref:Amino acid ABC transporter permease n=1 Tax=Streptomyces solicavernae TaxID=3043614 RepID=A0ABT6S323_9ACTN|nr:hypothetical protein [Streptomyces sp. B-S-A8]MDI3390413.1 hypothetical protein [Streptomyces sp. B-S-A8]
MGWDEWEQIKSEVRSDQDSHMQLAGTGGGSASGELKHSNAPWTSGAAVLEALRIDLSTSMPRLEEAHAGLSTGAEGLASTAAVDAVLHSWQQRLKGVRDECGHLQEALREVARAQTSNDLKVKSAFSRVLPGSGDETGGR